MNHDANATTCISDQSTTSHGKIQNVTFAKKHESLIASGFREISSRENQ